MWWLLLNPALGWPPDDAWAPAAGPASVDLSGDETWGLAGRDLIGDAANPGLLFAGTTEGLFVRLRFAGDPSGEGVRGVLLGDGDAFDVALLAGPSGLFAHPNPGGTPGTDPGFQHLGAPVGAGSMRVVPAAVGFFLDLHLDLAALGRTHASSFRLATVAGSRVVDRWTDLGGCVAAACPALSGVWSEPLGFDRDLDGVPDSAEALLGLDPLDQDSDDDGVPDGDEAALDADLDGLPDGLDCDSDDDGLLDGVEAGVSEPGPVTVLGVCFATDADPSTTSDPTLADSDGGGLPDGDEDRNRNGRLDDWETDPSDPLDDADTDADGIPDVLELLGADGVIDDVDSDGDGLSDLDEGLDDGDGDGVPAFLDDDSDGDGLLDADEGVSDTDMDGRIDSQDPDADDDGWPDALEGAVDTDGDGLIDALDPDSDGDGLPDLLEGRGDADGDGVPDRLDPDADGDGIADGVDGPGDPDGDGLPNHLDLDSDGDGLADALEGVRDADGDGTPNYLDLNSDGSGPSDGVEGAGDQDCDGVPNFLDADEEDGFCGTPPPIPSILPGENVEQERPVRIGPGSYGGCSTTPGLGGFGLLMMLAIRRRRGLAVLAAGLPLGASAQEVDAQRLRPVVDGPFLRSSTLAPSPGTQLGFALGHAVRPLVYRPRGSDELNLVASVSTFDLGLQHGVGDRVAVSASVPLHVGLSGFGPGGYSPLGDVGVGVSATPVARGLGEGEWRAGIVSRLTLPTGTTNWLGAGRTRLQVEGVFELLQRGWTLQARLGARTGTGRRLGATVIGPALSGALAAAVQLTPTAGLALEVDGEWWLGNAPGEGGWPGEWLLSGQVAVDPLWTLSAGVGGGLTTGIGAPQMRALFGVRRAFRAPAPP